MPSQGERSSRAFTTGSMRGLITGLCLMAMAGTALAQPSTTPAQTPFGTIYRPLDSDNFVPFSEPDRAPLHPEKKLAPKPSTPIAAPAEKPPAEPETAAPQEAAPAVATTAPVPARVPLPPRAPANRGNSKAPSAAPTPTPAPTPMASETPVKVPPPANLPAVSNLSEKQIIERANRYFNTTETLQANFTQLGGNQRTTGTLYLERPGRIRFAYNAPSTLEIVSDGKNVAIRDSKLNTSDVYSINQTPLKFLLRDPINLASDLKVLNVVRDQSAVEITLEDASTIGGKAQITLSFDQQIGTLLRWTIVDAQGFTTTVILSQPKRVKREG